MIAYEKYILPNKLRVLVHEDHTLPVAILNVLYDVGARDEEPGKTGFAHLFEHLMFGGSVNIPVFDAPLQSVGGENNAFTSNDLTNYYVQLPSANIETAFWLESDRMLGLAFSEKSLDVQRNVVIEEFKQRYLNQPYGDAWLKLRPLVYRQHPYQWSTIGKTIAHIEEATMDYVKQFFSKHYNPSNAILVIAGDVTTKNAFSLAEKWFGSIPSGTAYQRNLPAEPEQNTRREETVKAPVPIQAIYMAFPMDKRKSPAFYASEIIADLLSQGNSSRLYRQLVKNLHLFSSIQAYVTGELDPGMFVIEGKIMEGVSKEAAEKAVWAELTKLKTVTVSREELLKIQNKIESTQFFSEMNLLEKAINLAFFELMGDASAVNDELARFLSVTPGDLLECAKALFDENKLNVLYYQPI